MKKLITLNLIFWNVLLSNLLTAQSSQVGSAIDLMSKRNPYWQFTTHMGWDWPLYNYKNSPIKYKSGRMLGIGINRYWTKKWGVELDMDWYRNRVTHGIPNQINWFDGITGNFYKMNVTTTKNPINRFFLGVGPSRRWQVKDKLTIDAGIMVGAGYINGGEMLAKGKVDSPSLNKMLVYTSGWDHKINWAFKGQVRANYWLNQKWGVNGGIYYVCQGWNQMSTKNKMLVDNGFQAAGANGGWYNYYVGQQQGPANGLESYGDESSLRLKDDFSRANARQLAPFIQSWGLFAGLNYRLFPGNKEKKNGKYCLQVTARDKYTNELIPNTVVAIRNVAGVIVKTATTDAFGNVNFCDIKADDYTVDGVYNDVKLDGNKTLKSEFKEGETLRKEILYSDRSFIVKGRAVECNTTTGINGIKVIAENNELAIKKSTTTDANGNFTLTIPEKGEFNLYGQKDSFFSQTEIVNASNYNRDKTLFVKIEICADKIDCNKIFPLKNIHFDLDKYFIRTDAKPELNKLVQFLKDYPTVKIELSSHTDCRASHEYNQTLSQNRVNASADYLVSQGIDRSRIVAVGYGETRLLNECADGVNCTEAQHQINRRTEFKVICPK